VSVHKVKPDMMAALMQAGFELGFDEAIRLLEALEAAWGGEGYAVEMRKMRSRVLADRAKTIASVAERKGGISQ
jgi:hypothetical protein